MASSALETPIEIIANVSRVVTKVVDRISSDRNEVPLLVAAACVEALKRFSIGSQAMYGNAAWIEILENHSAVWAGCWGKNIHFWVATQFGEVVDLNASVAHRKRAHDQPKLKPLYSPPMLWSKEVPGFFRYKPQGVAALDLDSEQDKKRYELVLEEIREKCGPGQIEGLEAQFANEPILCPGRKILDDSHSTFRHYDRALSVQGIPQPPL